MNNSDLKRFITKLLVFLLPFFVLLIGWAYFEINLVSYLNFNLVPVDWKYVSVRYVMPFVPGPFYPRQFYEGYSDEGYFGRNVESDSPRSISRKIKFRFQTDEFGCRNSQLKWDTYDIVVVGDSFVEGATLSQEDTLPEVLGRRLNKKVYNFGCSTFTLNNFLAEERFQLHPPKVVILSSIERNIVDLPEPVIVLPQPTLFDGIINSLKKDRWFQNLAISYDKCRKALGWYSVYFRVHGPKETSFLSEKKGPFLFYQGSAARRDAPDAYIEKTSDVIANYQKVLADRGIRFFYLPIPNKESVYYGYLQNFKRPVYLGKLVKNLEKRKIDTVNLQTAFEKSSAKNGKILYQYDDPHWNAAGVRTTVDLILPKIQKLLAQK